MSENKEGNASFKSLKGSHCLVKKSTMIWTKGLRNKFLEAVKKLGVDKATPKKILELMNVDDLTRDHVSSYLQKYRIILKKIANANHGVETVSKPSLLRSSKANGASSNNSSLMLNHEKMNSPLHSGMQNTNPPILNSSSSCIPSLVASNLNATTSSDLTHSGSLPNEGYFMQEMANNVQQRNLIYDTTSTGVVNSVNSGNFGSLDGSLYGYGGCSTKGDPYNNNEMGSSSGVSMKRKLPISWNQEDLINNASFSNSSYVENLIGFERNYSCKGEDDFVLTEADIDSLWAYAGHGGEYGLTSNNTLVTLNNPNHALANLEFVQ